MEAIAFIASVKYQTWHHKWGKKPLPRHAILDGLCLLHGASNHGNSWHSQLLINKQTAYGRWMTSFIEVLLTQFTPTSSPYRSSWLRYFEIQGLVCCIQFGAIFRWCCNYTLTIICTRRAQFHKACKHKDLLSTENRCSAKKKVNSKNTVYLLLFKCDWYHSFLA